MMKRLIGRYLPVALLGMGSAILLFSCEQPRTAVPAANEALMTEYSEHLSVIMSENGRRSYLFKTPLVEGYTLASEPYREFRKGIEITTYQDDSLTTVDAVLTANYAIYYENRKLWEAKGDVEVIKSDGKQLFTQQLFWNAKTKRIYSNVDTKIVQTDNGNVFQGEGFESDEAFKEWRFRRFTGKMDVDVSQDDPAADSLGNGAAGDSRDSVVRKPAAGRGSDGDVSRRNGELAGGGSDPHTLVDLEAAEIESVTTPASAAQQNPNRRNASGGAHSSPDGASATARRRRVDPKSGMRPATEPMPIEAEASVPAGSKAVPVKQVELSEKSVAPADRK